VAKAGKNKEKIIYELAEVRQRITGLEKLETERKREGGIV